MKEKSWVDGEGGEFGSGRGEGEALDECHQNTLYTLKEIIAILIKIYYYILDNLKQ